MEAGRVFCKCLVNWASLACWPAATFLEAILCLTLDVIRDFWNTALFGCKDVVKERFYSQLFEGINVKAFFKEKAKEFDESPETCGDYLVHLIQRKLSPQFTDLATPPDQVRHEFFSFYALNQSETERASKLANAIIAWSKHGTWTM